MLLLLLLGILHVWLMTRSWRHSVLLRIMLRLRLIDRRLRSRWRSSARSNSRLRWWCPLRRTLMRRALRNGWSRLRRALSRRKSRWRPRLLRERVGGARILRGNLCRRLLRRGQSRWWWSRRLGHTSWRHGSGAGGVIGSLRWRSWRRFLLRGCRGWRGVSGGRGQRIKLLGVFTICDGHVLEEGGSRPDGSVRCRDGRFRLRSVSSVVVALLLLIIVLF